MSGELRNPSRFSPTRVTGWLAMPSSAARDFGVASALGKSMTERKSFEAPHGIKDIAAVVVQPAQRRAIIEALDITPSRWRQLVRQWQALGMAHRCDGDNVTLLLMPDPVCPRCNTLYLTLQFLPPDVSIPTAERSDPYRLTRQSLPPRAPIPSGSEHESGGPSPGAEQGLAVRDEEGLEDRCEVCTRPLRRVFPNQRRHAECLDLLVAQHA